MEMGEKICECKILPVNSECFSLTGMWDCMNVAGRMPAICPIATTGANHLLALLAPSNAGFFAEKAG
jgi:hypothetical protein